MLTIEETNGAISEVLSLQSLLKLTGTSRKLVAWLTEMPIWVKFHTNYVWSPMKYKSPARIKCNLHFPERTKHIAFTVLMKAKQVKSPFPPMLLVCQKSNLNMQNAILKQKYTNSILFCDILLKSLKI